MIIKTSLYLLTILLLIPSINTYTCTTTDSSLILGSSTVICVHIVKHNNALNTNSTQTYAFKVTVDKFSAFKVTGLKTSLNQHTAGNIYVVLQPQNSAVTLEMLLYSPTMYQGTYRALFSSVVNTQKGVVTAITDDNADCGNCDTTNNDVCTETTQYKCYTKSAKYPLANDPRIFVSWIGTDLQGSYMLSHTKRLSRFTQYSIGSIYSKAISAFTG